VDDQVCLFYFVNYHLPMFLQSLNMVDCPELPDLLLFIGTELEERDIPHHTKLSELITAHFKTEYNRIIGDINVSLHFL
jgi:hypothetical protein